MLDSFIIIERTLATNKDGVVSFLLKELGPGRDIILIIIFLSFFPSLNFCSLALRRQPACVKQQSESLCGVVELMCACVLVSCQRKAEGFARVTDYIKSLIHHTFQLVCNHLEALVEHCYQVKKSRNHFFYKSWKIGKRKLKKYASIPSVWILFLC